MAQTQSPDLTTPEEHRHLSTAEAAEKLGVSTRTIINMIERGSIHAYKVDPTSKSVYKIPAREVERLLRERERARPHEAV